MCKFYYLCLLIIHLKNLTVTDNVPGTNGLSQAKAQAFNITVRMPDDLHCTGGKPTTRRRFFHHIINRTTASTGNICTVRCRNNAVAGPFGGCFAVQQTDTRATSNRPETIATEQALGDVLDQVRQNQADFGVAVQANKKAGEDEAQQNLAAVEAILDETPTTRRFPQETPTAVRGGSGRQNRNGSGSQTGKGNGRNDGSNTKKGASGNPNGGNEGSGGAVLNRNGDRNGQN